MDVILHDVRTFQEVARQPQSIATAQLYWDMHQAKVKELQDAFHAFQVTYLAYKNYYNENKWRGENKPNACPLMEAIKKKHNQLANECLDAQARLLKAIEDNVWTIAGVGQALDLPMYEGWIATVRSNLSKLSMKAGMIQLTDEGKLSPSIEWEPANMSAIIQEHIKAKADLGL